ncbi:MAG: VOC family protein [Pseudonocardia sp.]|nr:VOC family protein [Pseudonocardia sp.]
MPTRDEKWPVGTPCWVDLATPDIAEATAFYGPVIGWTFQDSGEQLGHYHMCLASNRAAAGIGPIQAEDQPPAWTIYLASDDVDNTSKLVTENGGTIVVPAMDIPNIGRMAVGVDPTGAAFGMWQANPVIGIGIYNEPGSLVWEDARLTDPEVGKAFYSAVFDYTYAAVEGAPDGYQTFSTGGEALGGIGGLWGAPEGTPGHWLPYFQVADVDASVTAVQSGGGTVVMPADTTPFGRIAVAIDPFGVVFGLHSAVNE